MELDDEIDEPKATLRPCPFCGDRTPAFGTVRYSAAHVREQGWWQDTFHFVNCPACGVCNKGIVGHRSPSDAAERWNKRTPEPADA